MSLFGAILVSTAGGIAGSLVCYCFGRFGRRFIEKTLCSKYSSLKKGLEKAGRVFDKYGSKSVLIARVFPIARTYISIPAGLMGMNIYVFVIYTAVGSFVWNTMLISAGYFLGGYGSLIKGNILVLCYYGFGKHCSDKIIKRNEQVKHIFFKIPYGLPGAIPF